MLFSENHFGVFKSKIEQKYIQIDNKNCSSNTNVLVINKMQHGYEIMVKKYV